MAGRAYLDAGGAAPMSERTLDALRAGFSEGWADPGRLASEGRTARALLDGAREAIADVVGARAERVSFSPSVHLAFERLAVGMVAARRGTTRIAASAIERDALVHACEFAAPHGLETIGVSQDGHVDLAALRLAAEHPETAVVAVQHANQELGTIQDLAEVSAITRAAGVPLLVDATSSVGHVDAPEGWDALVAHPADWGGPSGLAVVALGDATRWLSPWPDQGGRFEDEWAPGGVSVPLALASAVALQERVENMAATDARLRGLVDRIRSSVTAIDGIDLHGDADARLPHVVTFSCLYVDGESLVSRLDREGFAIGSGSACTSSTLEPSRVLASIGALTHGNVRLALHPGITDADVDRFLAVLPTVVDDVRAMAGMRRS